MNGDDVIKHLFITGVKPTGHVLYKSLFGRVFVVNYNGTMCTAVKIHQKFVEGVAAEGNV